MAQYLRLANSAIELKTMQNKILFSIAILATLLLSGCVPNHIDWNACNGVSKNIYGTGEWESFKEYWTCCQVGAISRGYSSAYPAGDDRIAIFVPIKKQNHQDYVLLIAKPRIFGWRGTRRTEDGSLEAWLVRGYSVPGKFMASFDHPNLKKLATAIDKPTIPGFYRMMGEAQIRYGSELSFDVEMELRTEQNVPLYEGHFRPQWAVEHEARDPFRNSPGSVKARQEKEEFLTNLRKSYISAPAEVDLIYSRGRSWQILPYDAWLPSNMARRVDQRRLEKERAKGAAQP
jgi:hypothetical protein